MVPDPGHTKLRLSKEGLEAIERITTPIAAVAVSLRCNFLSTDNFYFLLASAFNQISLRTWPLLCSSNIRNLEVFSYFL